MEGQTFGKFIAEKRMERGWSLRVLAGRLGITAAYLSDVENSRRRAFDLTRLRSFARAVNLSRADTDRLYDLAGKDRGEPSPDVSEYLTDNGYICAALRTVRTLNANEDDWQQMLEELKNRKDEENRKRG